MDRKRCYHDLDYKFIFISQNPKETIQLGKKLGSLLQESDLIALNGDLGSGKTLLIQGIVSGLKCKNQVLSPSFSLIKEYSGRKPIYHFDLYRLTRPEEIEELGYEEYFYGKGITLIEWANKIEKYLPESFLSIKISMNEKNYFFRKITLESIGIKYRKIIEELKNFDHFRN